MRSIGITPSLVGTDSDQLLPGREQRQFEAQAGIVGPVRQARHVQRIALRQRALRMRPEQLVPAPPPQLVRAPRIVLRAHRRVEFGDGAPPSGQLKFPLVMLRVCPFGTKSSFRTGQGSRLAAGFRWTGPICDTGGIGRGWSGVLIPLVARAGVPAEVDSALIAARTGRGALLTVTGEPGIGKTRLAEEAAGRADGFEVVWTWGPAAAGGAALGPWSRVLRALAGGHAAVARLIADSPFLAALTDPAGPEAVVTPGARARSCPSTWPRSSRPAAVRRPVLVVFDDAHQAEDAVHWYERAAASLATMRAGDDEQACAALRLGAARLAAGDLDGGTSRVTPRGRARPPRRAPGPTRPRGARPRRRAGRIRGRAARRRADQPARRGRAGLPDGHSALIALVTARLSIASTLLLPEARRLELAAEAVNQARSAHDDAALAAALAALCDAVAGRIHCDARRAHATEIIDLAERLRDPVLGLLGRRLRLAALLEAGAIADWEADALAYRAAAEALRHPLYAWYVPLWRGMRALARGRFGECRAALAEAAAIGERGGSGNATMLVQTQMWCLARRGGATPPACWACWASWRRSRFPLRGSGSPGRSCWPRSARTEDARAQLDAMVPLLPAMPRIRSGCPRWLAARIEAEAAPVQAGPDHADHAFRRDGEVWTLAYRGREVRMRDSKGLRDLHALLAGPGTAVAALDLAAAVA